MADLQTALEQHKANQAAKPPKAPKIKKGAKAAAGPKTVKVTTPDGQVAEIPMATLQDDPELAAKIIAVATRDGRVQQKLFLKEHPEFNDAYNQVSVNLHWLTEKHKNPIRRLLNWIGDTWVGTIVEVGAKVLVLTVTGWVLYDKYQAAQTEG